MAKLFLPFPRSKIGGIESASHKQVTDAKLAISQGGLQQFAFALDALTPATGAILGSFSGTGDAIMGMEPCKLENGGLRMNCKSIGELTNELEVAKDELNKAITLCEKSQSRARKLRICQIGLLKV